MIRLAAEPPQTIHLSLPPAVLGQPTVLTCSWPSSLDPVSEVRFVHADTRQVVYKFYRNSTLNQTFGVLAGSTARVAANEVVIYVPETRTEHLASYRCLAWDSHYVVHTSATVRLRLREAGESELQ